jgi:hypothetical protein
MVMNDWSVTPVRRLLANVVALAIEDLHRPAQHESARAFFESERFEWCADALGLDVRRIRQQVSDGIDPHVLRNIRRARKGRDGGVIAARADAIRGVRD